MSDKFSIVEDDDGHVYVVPAARRGEFDEIGEAFYKANRKHDYENIPYFPPAWATDRREAHADVR